MQSNHKLSSYIQNKKVVFITTKNLSYIRNVQEIEFIKKNSDTCCVIGSESKFYLVRLVKVYFQLLYISLRNFDTIWLGFAPQLILPIFYLKVMHANITVVADFFISMFDTLCTDRKIIKQNSIGGKLLHHIDSFTLKHADIIICDTNAHGQFFSEEFGVESNKLFTMYLHADSSIYHPMPVTRPDYLKGRYVVLYFGSVLPLQGTEVILQAMNLLKDRKELFFYFIGPIKNKQQRNSRPVSDNIRYIDWLKQEELAKYINYSDLCLAGHFNASIEKAKRTIPGKAYIYQAIKKPMILGDNPANHELFTNDEKVTFVEMGNADALATAILRLSHIL